MKSACMQSNGLNRSHSMEVTVNSCGKLGKVLRIDFLRNALRRLRNSAPRMDFYKYKHEDCKNSDNGKCRAAHFTNLNPKETACPHFKPK